MSLCIRIGVTDRSPSSIKRCVGGFYKKLSAYEKFYNYSTKQERYAQSIYIKELKKRDECTDTV